VVAFGWRRKASRNIRKNKELHPYTALVRPNPPGSTPILGREARWPVPPRTLTTTIEPRERDEEGERLNIASPPSLTRKGGELP
jgi:hypothetical protein